SREPSGLAAPREEDEEQAMQAVPAINVHASEPDPLEDVDKSVSMRVRTLYAYEGQRAEDLSFGENIVLEAHPSKSGGDWWYGKTVRDGKSGFFPRAYVQEFSAVKAKALYPYEGSSADELPFAEGDTLNIVEHAEADWWKAEHGGIVFVVPAAYLELQDTQTPAMTTPAALNDADAARELEGSETDTDTDGSETDYISFSDSDTDDHTSPTEERAAREAERQMVLEAAGLVVKQEEGRRPPPRPMRRRPTARATEPKKHRPAPAVPAQRRRTHDAEDKVLPSVPPAVKLDDAYERYETFKLQAQDSNRFSVTSFETTPPSPGQSSIHSVVRTPSRAGEASVGPGSSLAHLGSSAGGILSQLLGRSKTPSNDGEVRPRLIISGPISGPEQSSSGSGSGFGSSWSSLVDKSALEGLPERERKRQEAIFEFIATEAAYVRDLQLIVEVFYSSVIDMLEPKAKAVVFANVEDLLLTNTTFLSSLEDRQRDCRLYVDHIGDILDQNIRNMSIYREYCVNQANAAKVLQSLRETKPELAAHLQRLREDPAVRNLDLSSYLLVPMQRITRYPLLIKQILHYTEPDEDSKRTEHALHTAEKILGHINEEIRSQENRERLKELSQDLWIGNGRLDLTAPTRTLGERKLLKEGVLAKTKSGRKLRTVLCNDILILTDEQAKTLYRVPVNLTEVNVQIRERDDTSLELSTSFPRRGDVVSLRAASSREAHSWVVAIQDAARICQEAHQREAIKRSRPRAVQSWQPNVAAVPAGFPGH
ncbi:hypothetical protein K488DRAFT_60641, partial [Vararia minispora EC-137]